jgi:DNA-3-methyladenine glycosylase I
MDGSQAGLRYCAVADHPYHGPYHDHEHGFPVDDENRLFERLMLEINQAGMSRLTILKKREAFRSAFHHFEVDRVAAYGDEDRDRLLRDAGIIRNVLKVNAAIVNARRIQQLRRDYGSFTRWLTSYHPLSCADWKKLFSKTFVFAGGEIVGNFLVGIGYLPGAHQPGCPAYERVLAANPPWRRATPASFVASVGP